MDNTSAFAAATAVEPVGEGTWAGEVHPGWDIGGKPNGGYLLAILGRAALLATARPHPLAVSAHFLRPPEFGPLSIRTRVLRTGRNVSSVSVELWQHDKLCLTGLVSAGTLADTAAPNHLEGAPLALPPVEDCLPTRQPDLPNGARVALLDHVEERLDPATGGFAEGRPGGHTEMRGWQRFADGTPVDPLALLLFVDSFPPVTFELGFLGWVPTVELTVYIRGVPEPTGWFATAMRGRLVDGGWMDEEAEVWDSAGRLVAQSRQLAGARVPG